ncbi:MAG: Capsular exopolysaccharide family [Chthoniobacter sp.]|jgi:capsular exopolysaccharide synthesis family protein|nr:Capsular exopolysaccharide family [Chthoniobacter sp.]
MPFGAALSVKLYRYKTLIRRRWWILALTIGLGLGYQSYLIFTKPRLFESVSRLNIREELISDSKGGFSDTTGNFFGTSIEQIKSPLVQEGAAQRVKLTAPDLSGQVSVSANIVPRSNILVVSGLGRDPEYIPKFIDAMVEEFLQHRSESRNVTGKDVMRSLEDQRRSKEKELEEQKTKLQEFTEKNNMSFWNDQAKSNAVFLSGLNNKQAQLQNELQRLENLTPDQLLTTPAQNAAPRGAPVNPPADRTEAGNAGAPAAPSGDSSDSNGSFNAELYTEYLRKSQELSQRKADLATWSLVWKPKHRRLQMIQSDIFRITNAIDTIKAQNREMTASRIVTVQAELKSIAASIETWEKKVLEASRKDAEYQTRVGDVARTQSQLEKLIGTMATIDVGTNTSPDPWVVMQKASKAVEVPRGDTRHILTGLLGGLVVGMIILLLLDRSDDRVASSTEMLEHFAEPILGQIPNVADTREVAGLPLLQSEDERYTYAEAFRSLRSSLIFMPNQSELKTVLITSAIPNEGKSTIASNLAITMAAAGARVLLVDADLRRGDLAELFNLDTQTGLTNILRGELDWRSAVIDTQYPTLSLIQRGPVTNQSGELLLKPLLVSLLEQFKECYDLTIFNTAPILATDDTPTLAPNFDGALMVVRAQFTSARLTRNSLNALYQRQVNVLGLILNCVDTEMPDYHYYQYSKYYAA